MDSKKIAGLRQERRRRAVALSLIASAVLGSMVYGSATARPVLDNNSTAATVSTATDSGQRLAVDGLAKLEIKGRAPKTGYSRDEFGNGWTKMGSCTMRDWIMARDFSEVQFASDTDCSVVGGILHDPYTGKTITFSRSNPSAVQIEHIVALSDAWQKGAQQLSPAVRAQLANDPLELIAVDGPANGDKSDSDAASWLMPNKQYRCRYIARQIAIKAKYSLWVTRAEHTAMQKVLQTCPQQALPNEQPLTP